MTVPSIINFEVMNVVAVCLESSVLNMETYCSNFNAIGQRVE